ncbi:hypothetical protein [Lactobacillus bombicola]|uniref:Uncharacterized protein n=1 Tax=Lactobacillus bombicola TaxID=1505723 RepID=A0ABX9LWX0_9LACO|nr:hypothetical protein [Lactobacillus bombicola]RHW49010.1 hypothetical protein DS833_05770 [Lactobacillus bombicola]RHW53545.1 hypothetical protein DS834_00995 [Lactobacillus bombicola]
MKIKKYIIAIVLIATMGVSTACTINNAKIVDAKINTAVFPKKIRGTWYSGNGNKTVITPKKYISYDGGHKYVSYLHVRHNNSKMSNKTQNWIYFFDRGQVNGRRWITIKGWNAMMGFGTHYNVSKLNGHYVLTTAMGEPISGSSHSYKSLKLARQLKNQRYSGFKYW